MRRLAIACAALLTVLVVLLARDGVVRGRAPAPGAGAETERSDAERARTGDTAERAGALPGRTIVAIPRVDVRVGGVVLLDGKGVSLRALYRACKGKDTVVVRVEDEVSWAHVEWVLATLQGAGVRRIRFDLPDGAVETCFESDYWKQDARHVAGGHTAGLVTVTAEDLDAPDLAGRLTSEAARIRSECRLRPLGQIFPHSFPEGWPSFGIMARGLRALSDADVEIDLRFGFWLDDAVPDDKPLPPPPDLPSGFMDPWGRCSCRSGVVAVDLPVADMGEEDKGQEEDDRLIVQIDKDGRIFCRRDLSLEDLGAVLRTVKDRYHLKMRQQGKSGVEKSSDGTLLSKVYVLIRADRATSARHVGWILHVLAEENFYKVQFAVQRGLWADDQGPCVGGLGGKIQVFLPTDGVPGIVGSDELSIHVYADRQAFGVGAVRGLDAEGLVRLVREEHESARARPATKEVVAVHVEPDVAWERAIAAVNEITRAGIEKIVFVGLAPPDAATRRMSPLPR